MRILGIFVLGLSLCSFAQVPSLDSDHDGLSDEVEQSLLARFRPTFMTSAHDCAGSPTRFKAGSTQPIVGAKDGTIYGQVFPISGDRVEVHYYTLWDKDCGRISHPLDAEHAAALVAIDGRESKALYWYAGAHENTVCDISSGARASAVDAETKGPVVWSASGKHALYFKKEMCKNGCGADSCADDTELAVTGPVINLGELKSPMNGSDFVNSPGWLLSTKMDSDFPKEILALIDSSPSGEISTLRGRSTLRGTIQGSGMVYDNITGSAATGARHTGAALDTANTHTSSSVGKATKSTGNALTRAWRAVFKTKQKEPPAPPETTGK